MVIPYYVRTLRELARVLEGVEPIEDTNAQPTREHITWMAAQVERLSRHSLKDAVKAGRWIGWMLLAAEINGLWDNSISRDLIRKDVAEGNDLPAIDVKT